MYFSTILLLAAVTAQGAAEERPDHFNWGGHSVVVFRCDFTHYPPQANVEFSHAGCDYAISFDKHPHLRLTTSEKSRFAMKFRLPGGSQSSLLGRGTSRQCRQLRKMRIARVHHYQW